jgi:LacI family transcriptional regulator
VVSHFSSHFVSCRRLPQYSATIFGFPVPFQGAGRNFKGRFGFMITRMKDVADRAGVSVSTVSHVLNKTRFVAAETAERVLTAVRELKYYQDAQARNLARGRSNFFGLIVSDIGNPFFPEIIKGFECSALAQGFDLLLCNTNYEPIRTISAVRMMIQNKVRGVAVMTSEFGPHLVEDLTAQRVGVVFLDLGPVRRFVANIRLDYAQGIHEAVDHLFGLGHRSIGFIAGPQNLRSAVIRREAFMLALRRRRLCAHSTVQGDHRAQGGAAAAKALLRSPSLPTAIVCSNDLTAIGVVRELMAAGVSVPEEVSVVGFDDIEIASFMHPALTTVAVARREIGELAFKALNKILRSNNNKGAEYVVETHLIARSSTGQVPKRKAAIEPNAKVRDLVQGRNHASLPTL